MHSPFRTIRATFVLVIASTASVPVDAQAPSNRAAAYLAYVRDSLSIDSIVPLVPTDSLRALYSKVPIAADPKPIVQALQCEAYRLWYRYGRAAEIAEDRVRVSEWMPQLDTAIVRVYRMVSLDWYFPVGPRHCGVSANTPYVPERLQYPLRDPSRPTRVFPAGSSIDSLRRGRSYFEAILTDRRSGRDSVIALAGRAELTFRGPVGLDLVLYDETHTDHIFVITLIHPGAEYLGRGTYPIIAAQRIGARDVVEAYLQGTSELSAYDGSKPMWGTLNVAAADTVGADGSLQLSIAHNSAHPWGMRSPPLDYFTDTLRISVRFRAVYEWDEEQTQRVITRFPLMPHRFVADRAPTPSKTFLDESTPCETLPIYSPESVLSSLPANYPRDSARAALSIRPDSLGRVNGWAIGLLAIDDGSLTRTFLSQTGLRFRPSTPDHVSTVVRCTLTLHRR